jgi:hypothetical protein
MFINKITVNNTHQALRWRAFFHAVLQTKLLTEYFGIIPILTLKPCRPIDACLPQAVLSIRDERS